MAMLKLIVWASAMTCVVGQDANMLTLIKGLQHTMECETKHVNSVGSTFEKSQVGETGQVVSMDKLDASIFCWKDWTYGFTESSWWVMPGCRGQFTVCYSKPSTGTTTTSNVGGVNGTVGTHDSEDKFPPESACMFRQGFFPRQIVSLTEGYDVMCDTVTHGGGWIVFQKRTSEEVDFDRNWQNYTEGFGDLTGNFWLGLEKVYRLCNKKLCELRVDFTYNDVSYYAEYEEFWLAGPSNNYTLNIGTYHGTAGDSMRPHNGHTFTTKDADHDKSKAYNCAVKYGGPWWYNNCGLGASLNGIWGSKGVNYKGVVYNAKTGWANSVNSVEMKFRFAKRE